jgi:hypothetical protein
VLYFVGMNKSLDEIAAGLIHQLNTSTDPLVHEKCNKALAKVSSARTLLEKAAQTLIWAEYYDRTAAGRPSGQPLVEVFAKE